MALATPGRERKTPVCASPRIALHSAFRAGCDLQSAVPPFGSTSSDRSARLSHTPRGRGDRTNLLQLPCVLLRSFQVLILDDSDTSSEKDVLRFAANSRHDIQYRAGTATLLVAVHSHFLCESLIQTYFEVFFPRDSPSERRGTLQPNLPAQNSSALGTTMTFTL